MPVTSAVDELHDQLDQIAHDPSADPAERVANLRSFRRELATLVGAADRYIADQELQREGAAMHRTRQFIAARAEANARGDAVAQGLPPESLDSAGVLPHAELDRRQADGSIEEVLGIPTDPDLREAWSEKAREAALAARRRNAEARRGGEAPARDRELAGRVGDAARQVEQEGKDVPEGQAKPASTLDDIERLGLNAWPEKGEVAQRVLGKAKDTQELHRAAGAASPGGGGAVYSSARKPVHDAVAGRALAGPALELLGEEHAITRKLTEGKTLTDQDKEVLRAAASAARGGEKPSALFMGGGSASGKSSALRAAPELVPSAAVHIDPDAFKEQLPEYQEMVKGGERYAASGAHEESADLAKRVQAEARELGLNMLVDGTGDSKAAQRDEAGNVTEPGKFAKKLIDADKAGYKVNSLYVTIPTDEAVQRSVKRAQKSGRFVPVPEVRNQHRNVSANFPEIAALPFVNDLKVFDNQEQEPRLIAQGSGGKIEPKDEELYRQFLAKAGEGA